MKCDNHPSVAAIGICEQCSTALCGICARFSAEAVYCEKCEQLGGMAAAAEKKNRQHESPGNTGAMAGLLREEEERQRTLPKAESRRKPDRGALNEKVQMAIVIACCILIVYQITQSIGSGGILGQREIAAQEQSRNQIEACMLVFWEIAMQFSNGQQPNTTLRCPDTDAPLQVARQDGDVIVRHPQPSALGVSDLYVRRSNPTPILVE